jgi:hypothetical protein
LFDPRTAVATPRLGLRVQFRCISCWIFVEQHGTPYSEWSRVLPEKLTGPEPVKFPACYGTRRFITPFTTACHLSLSWANRIALERNVSVSVEWSLRKCWGCAIGWTHQHTITPSLSWFHLSCSIWLY